MLTIKTDRLYVEIAEPMEMPNCTCRFDRAGFVSEVVLDGDIRYCAAEPRNLAHPSSGGRGFCSEVRLETSSEAAIGERFAKPGVGLLLKDSEEDYIFHKHYDEVSYPISIEKTEDGYIFRTEPIPCNGYALRQEKRISVVGNRLTMTHTITNVGEKAVDLEEYNHNMVSIDGMAIGPDYKIIFDDLDCLPDGVLKELIEGYAENFESKDGVVSVRKYSNIATLSEVPADHIRSTGKFSWTLNQTAAKACMRVTDGFTPNAVNLWAVDHLVSAEVFHDFRLEPNETHTWERNWEFDRI